MLRDRQGSPGLCGPFAYTIGDAHASGHDTIETGPTRRTPVNPKALPGLVTLLALSFGGYAGAQARESVGLTAAERPALFHAVWQNTEEPRQYPGDSKRSQNMGRRSVMMTSRIFGESLRNTVLAFAFSLVSFAVFGTPALAGELPKQGNYSTKWAISGPYTAIEIGEDQSAWSSTFTAVIWNDAGEGILHDMSGNCVGMGSQEPNAPFMDSGYCAYADADGDQIFEYWYETEEGKGTMTMLGGTGKFAGIQASATYEYVYTPDAPEGTFNGYGHSKGSYTLP